MSTTILPTEGTPIQRAIIALNVVKPTKDAISEDIKSFEKGWGSLADEHIASLERALAVCGSRQFRKDFGLTVDQSARLAETLDRWLTGWKKSLEPKPPKQIGLREFFTACRVSGPIKSPEGLTLIPVWYGDASEVGWDSDDVRTVPQRTEVVVSNSEDPLSMSAQCKLLLRELRDGGYGPESATYLRPDKRDEAIAMLDRWAKAWFAIGKKYENDTFGNTGASAKPLPAAKMAKRALKREADAATRRAMKGKG
jgi:hypothetical protein